MKRCIMQTKGVKQAHHGDSETVRHCCAVGLPETQHAVLSSTLSKKLTIRISKTQHKINVYHMTWKLDHSSQSIDNIRASEKS